MDSLVIGHILSLGYLYFYSQQHWEATGWENECSKNAFGAHSDLILHMEM